MSDESASKSWRRGRVEVLSNSTGMEVGGGVKVVTKINSQGPGQETSILSNPIGLKVRGEVDIQHEEGGSSVRQADHEGTPAYPLTDGSAGPSYDSARPGPNPLQRVRNRTKNTEDESSSEESQTAAPTAPAPPPNYAMDVLLARAAQNHLGARIHEIGRALQKTRWSIRPDMWVAQVGFMHGRKQFEGKVKGHGLYGREHQIILITVFDSWAVSEEGFTKLAGRLSREIGIFHGLLTWGARVTAIAPSASYESGEGFTEKVCSGLPRDFTPNSQSLSGAEVSVAASNLGDAKDGANYMTTHHAFKIEKGDERNGSQAVTFTKLSFHGPQGYELCEASVCIRTDSPCTFTESNSSERGEVNCAGQYEETVTHTEKEATTIGGMLELSKTPKFQASTSRMMGEDNATALKTMRNALRIDVDMDLESKGAFITYKPKHPALDKRDLILQEDLPRLQISPTNRANLSAITARTFAAWTLGGHTATKNLGYFRRLTRSMGFGGREHLPATVAHADVVFCTEVNVPRGTVGGYSAVRNIEEAF